MPKLHYNSKEKSEMYKRLFLFSKCEERVKEKIFYAAIKNNARFYRINKTSNPPEIGRIAELILNKDYIPRSNLHSLLNNYVPTGQRTSEKYHKLNHNDFESKLQYVIYDLSQANNNPFINDILINLWLINNNSCPFIFFAFDKYYDILKDISLIPAVAELSIFYLLRLQLLPDHARIADTEKLIAQGAYCRIVKQTHTNIIQKIPINLAAISFINDQEIHLTKYLMSTGLSNFLPKLFNYDTTTKVITKEYIVGKTGHQLLATDFFVNNNKAINNLRDFYTEYVLLKKSRQFNLDIHPGNFVWSKERRQWFLIDPGPIPKIGSEYYPLDSFNRYFKKIWLERYHRMKNEPIRSVLI